MTELTPTEKKIYSFIVDYYRNNNSSPTLTEISNSLGFKSLTSVQRAIKTLVNGGLLIKEHNQKRGIELPSYQIQTINIPILGRAVCGTPSLAIQNNEGFVPTDTKFIHGDPDEYFYLKAVGDSMNQSNINDGDLVLVSRREQPRQNSIIVALIEDSATIKHYVKGDGYIVLKPNSDNELHKPIIMHSDFQIQGVVEQVFTL